MAQFLMKSGGSAKEQARRRTEVTSCVFKHVQLVSMELVWHLSQSLSSPLSSLPSPSLTLLSLSLSRNLSRHLSPTLSRTSLYHRQDSFSQERREIDFKIQLYTTTTTHRKLFRYFQGSYPQVLYLFGNLS